MEVENEVLEDVWFVSKWVIFHFHDQWLWEEGYTSLKRSQRVETPLQNGWLEDDPASFGGVYIGLFSGGLVLLVLGSTVSLRESYNPKEICYFANFSSLVSKSKVTNETTTIDRSFFSPNLR